MPLYCTVNGTVTLENGFGVSKELNIKLSYDSAIPFLGIYPTEAKTYVYTKICKQIFLEALFIIAKNWKKFKSPSTGDGHNLVYLHKRISFSNKME